MRWPSKQKLKPKLFYTTNELRCKLKRDKIIGRARVPISMPAVIGYVCHGFQDRGRGLRRGPKGDGSCSLRRILPFSSIPNTYARIFSLRFLLTAHCLLRYLGYLGRTHERLNHAKSSASLSGPGYVTISIYR